MPGSPKLEPLASLYRPVLSQRGHIYEGDVFSCLRSHPEVVRSFEFAVADGAIHCGKDNYLRGSEQTLSYGARYDKVVLRQAKQEAAFILFDVKSTTTDCAGAQTFISTQAQADNIAFYICVFAANTGVVALIPNLRQKPSAPAAYKRKLGDDVEMSVHTSRPQYLDPAQYEIDPCYAPYLIPTDLLPEAMDLIQRCVAEGIPYRNPWTSVCFPTWTPSLRSMQYLEPVETSQHYTSLRALREIQRCVKALRPAKARVDFIGLQPRIADFKIVMSDPDTSTTDSYERQVFVQHKIDSHERARNARLEHVPIARSSDSGIQWFFTVDERFDYIMYEFTFGRGIRAETIFYFLPEYVIPNSFYSTLEQEQSFERSEFDQFKIHKQGPSWAEKIINIISNCETPRRAGYRPCRNAQEGNLSTLSDLVKGSTLDEHDANASRAISKYYQVTKRGHQQLYERIMSECASRTSGLVVSLARNHPVGDFGFVKYSWTDIEAHNFLTTRTPPRRLQELPPDTPVVPFYFMTRDFEMTQEGLEVRPALFRRLNSCGIGKLLLCDLFGSDQARFRQPLVLIPSEDIRATVAQRKLYASSKVTEASDKWITRMPSISELLSTGLRTADYTVHRNGPMVYRGSNDECLWSLLMNFLEPQHMQYPIPYTRQLDTTLYQHSLQSIHQYSVDEDVSQVANQGSRLLSTT